MIIDRQWKVDDLISEHQHCAYEEYRLTTRLHMEF